MQFASASSSIITLNDFKIDLSGIINVKNKLPPAPKINYMDQLMSTNSNKWASDKSSASDPRNTKSQSIDQDQRSILSNEFKQNAPLATSESITSSYTQINDGESITDSFSVIDDKSVIGSDLGIVIIPTLDALENQVQQKEQCENTGSARDDRLTPTNELEDIENELTEASHLIESNTSCCDASLELARVKLAITGIENVMNEQQKILEDNEKYLKEQRALLQLEYDNLEKEKAAFALERLDYEKQRQDHREADRLNQIQFTRQICDSQREFEDAKAHLEAIFAAWKF